MEDLSRRGFLRALGLGVAAAAAPKVTYSFLGGILRPRKDLIDVSDWKWRFQISERQFRQLNPHLFPHVMERMCAEIRAANESALLMLR